MITGSLHRPVIESAALEGNPLGDPAVREVPVYLPPDDVASDPAGLPLVLVLAGYTGRGEGATVGTPWDPSFPERYETLLRAGQAEPCVFVFPDGFTKLGGSQYVNSEACGRYRDHIVGEVVPLVEEAFGVGGSRERRGVMGKSSGGFGALHLSFEHPDVFSALASHSGDCGFELCFQPDFHHLLAQLDIHGSVEAFVAAFDASPRKTGAQIMGLMMVAMAACYSPDPNEPMGLALPVEMHTGRLRKDVWERWMAFDPVIVAEERGDVLKDFGLVFIDAGTRDEYRMQYGARQLADALSRKGVAVQHEEFDDGHRGISYRYDRSIPPMTRALSP